MWIDMHLFRSYFRQAIPFRHEVGDPVMIEHLDKHCMGARPRLCTISLTPSDTVKMILQGLHSYDPRVSDTDRIFGKRT